MTRPIVFSFEGRSIEAEPGWTIAAALAAAGEHRLRETRSGAARGPFCGMGVCQECLVTVDGLPNRRACMTKARQDMAVTRQSFPGALPAATRGAPAIGYRDLPRLDADVTIVGGGAGGLSAALAARKAGLDVVLMDERPTAGGQYFKQMCGEHPPRDAQQAEGRALRAAIEGADVRILDGAEVFSPGDGPGSLLATIRGRAHVVTARAIVVAAGAYERAHVVPGWTLPGVMTTGAVQTLVRSYGALPGRRILIAGNGPLNLQVAVEAAEAGAEIVAVVEAAPIFAPSRFGALVRMAAADRALTAKGIGLTARARRIGIPVVAGEILKAVQATQTGLSATVGPLAGGKARRFEVDVVALGYGFQPSNELLRMLGAAQDFDARFGTLRTRRDAAFETTVADVFAVGDCAGLGGAPAAIAEGVVAAARIGARLRGGIGPELATEAAAANRALAGHRRFQDALWDLYRAERAGLALAGDDTLVCRCEDVTKARIDAALAEGGGGIGDIKRRTRCGMGRCQGRYCGPTLADAIAAREGRTVVERDFFAPRGPAKPVTIAEIVGLGAP